MIKEYKRKEENKKELQRLQKEKEEHKKQRKEQRNAARERHRIGILLDKLQSTSLGNSSLEDFNPAITKVYDIRDPNAKRDGIMLIGGFPGELIITFTCLLDYILANPQNASFTFTPESIEAFLKDLLIHENFTEGTLTLHVTENPNKEAEGENDFSGVDEESLAKFAKNKSHVSDYGLAFLFDMQRDLVANAEFISILYKVIAKIVKMKTQEQVPLPEMPVPDAEGNEPSDEDKSAAQKKVDEAILTNQQIDKFNEDVQRMHSKVKVQVRP